MQKLLSQTLWLCYYYTKHLYIFYDKAAYHGLLEECVALSFLYSNGPA